VGLDKVCAGREAEQRATSAAAHREKNDRGNGNRRMAGAYHPPRCRQLPSGSAQSIKGSLTLKRNPPKPREEEGDRNMHKSPANRALRAPDFRFKPHEINKMHTEMWHPPSNLQPKSPSVRRNLCRTLALPSRNHGIATVAKSRSADPRITRNSANCRCPSPRSSNSSSPRLSAIASTASTSLIRGVSSRCTESVTLL